eukprot:gene1044-12260_t
MRSGPQLQRMSMVSWHNQGRLYRRLIVLSDSISPTGTHGSVPNPPAIYLCSTKAYLAVRHSTLSVNC